MPATGVLNILFLVSGMWAKKNALGKEGVAKLVDDTYRYYFSSMYLFNDLLIDLVLPYLSYMMHNL